MPTYDYDRWILRLNYSVNLTPGGVLEHKQDNYIRVVSDPDIGEVMDAITLELRNGSTMLVMDVADEWGALIEDIYADTASFGNWQLLKIAANTSIAVFYSQYDIGHVGSSAAANVPAWQSTFTCRTLGGKWAKLQFMESSYGTQTSIIPPYPTEAANLMTYACNPLTPFLGLDNNYLWASMHFSNGQNEKLWRARYRS